MKQEKNKITQIEWDKKFKMNWDETPKLDVPGKIDHDSINKYKELVKNNPDDADAYNNLAAAYADLEMYEKEIESYKRALKIDPYNELVHLFLGFTYCNLDDRDSALEECEILRILDSEWAYHLNKEIISTFGS